MTRTGKILLTTGIVLLLAVPVALKVFRGGEVKQVELATVEQRVITPTILASGSLTYQTEISMRSEVMGRVQSLYVKEGDPVKQGDVLLRLDPATLQTQVDALSAGVRQSRLSIERARVSADTIETKWKRYQTLRESGVIDANTYDEVRSQNDQAKVELSSTMEMAMQTEAQLNQARENLAKTVPGSKPRA
jgi:HlyD family secretion protein